MELQDRVAVVTGSARGIGKSIAKTLLGALFVMLPGAQDGAVAGENPTVVVGTYDSRAVAVAYAQSDAFGAYIVAQQADVAQVLERAKTAGDENFVTELEGLGPAMQKRLHEQGFGSAPVDDILARIEDKLPEIAERAGVDVIVSKWTLTYRDPAAKFVDVTGLIAAEFDPDERTLKMIESLAGTEPVPPGEISHDH